MESPRNHGGSEEEEYSSCESGWTMYIEDAFQGNDHSSVVVDDDDDNDDDSLVKDANDGYENDDGDNSDEESDDSMASDASSGPSNQLPKNINKHAARKNGSKQVYQSCCLPLISHVLVVALFSFAGICFFVEAVPNKLSARFSVGTLLYKMYPVLQRLPF